MYRSHVRITERSFYPALIKKINAAGGTGVSEVTYNSDPDIIFSLGGRKWILSVKIGATVGIIKSAFLQYLRHKQESQIPFGIVLLLPESVRNIEVDEESILSAIDTTVSTTLIDACDVKEELRDRPFPKILDYIKSQILDRLSKKLYSYFSLKLVTELLQEQVSEMMKEINIDEQTLMYIVTDRKLLMDIGHLNKSQAEDVARFLASYILMSQILFLRLFYAEQSNRFTEPIYPPNRHSITRAFKVIQDINYRPIYSVNVLDVIEDNFLKDTFELIWGLELERVRHELPGRIFHELMPSSIRKMLAAFYTRPHAADLLSKLAIDKQNDTVFDPACGSGTILVSAYKRKLEVYQENRLAGNPHKRFCEEEIFGADIMPFAVHLTSANLAAMNVASTIERTQIIQDDSIKLAPGKVYEGGITQLEIFQTIPEATTIANDKYKVELSNINIILMNPPFTKVERRIRDFVDMRKFYNRCGGEVGLWGHFIALADEFLKQNGIFGAVLPINVLRGRESNRVRHILFEEWEPLYIIKATQNYGFSEWAEYRDILFVARKRRPDKNHKAKFCFIKKDLTKMTDDDVANIGNEIKRSKTKLRSDILDINFHNLSELSDRFDNLMWYCSGISFSLRDKLVSFVEKFQDKLLEFPENYFKEGYRPVPKGVSKFLFITREISEARVQNAFLRFNNERKHDIKANSPLGASYNISLSCLTRTIRTAIGLKAMNITDKCDYIANRPYAELDRVKRATGFQAGKRRIKWDIFWDSVKNEIENKKTRLIVLHRINPFSPATFLTAYFSDHMVSPSNQVNIIDEPNTKTAKAVCVLLNSVLFFVNFFLLKEESTGRYINIRFYDLYQMKLYPDSDSIEPLAGLYEKYKNIEFPSLRNQFDLNYEQRYIEFWDRERSPEAIQEGFWNVLDQPINPATERMQLDLEICNTLGIETSEEELKQVYDAFIKEMIITRHLTRD